MNTKNKAIACILISAFGFSIMNLCVKLSGDLPSIEKSFLEILWQRLLRLSYYIEAKQVFPARKRIFRH